MFEFSEQVLEEDDNYEDDEGDDVKSRIDLGEQNSKMGGFSDIFGQIRDLLLVRQWPKPKIEMVSLVGTTGIGKTTLAKKVYEDPSISRRFDHLAWVTVGQKYHVKDIFQRVLNQLGSKTDGETTQEEDRVITKGDENGDDVEEDDALLLEVYNNYLLAQDFYENLQDKGTYLIVFDDVWDQHIFDSLQGSLPFDSNYRILIFSTTRRDHVGASGDRFKLRLLNSEESWDLLREKVFGEGSPCPPELVKAGKKIAENCEGLPLTIVTIADILSKADHMNPEYWNSVAEKENSVFTDAYDRMCKVLYPSYEKLPQHFKALFLYLAIFPQNYEINVTKLSMLWAAEGFFDASQSKDLALTCLEDFVLSNLVLDRQSNYDYTLKTCTLHSVFWYLCVREAGRNKLFHVLKKSADSSAQGMQNQRRLCIHNNVLFGIKDAYKSMASSSTSRSLICTGPYHQYPVPICSSLRLLRVLDALTIRFYEFPVEVLKLVQLRYLALIYDGKIPPFISKLWSLQFLIVHRYLSITKLHEDESYLPVEIWDIKELKHLQVMGSNLPDPRDGAVLPNLVTLLDVTGRSCTKGVLKGLPNLERLGVRVEFSVDGAEDGVEPFDCFNHISHLNELESLKCVIVNPELMRSPVIAPPALGSHFAERLQKLSMNGFGYPWEDMRAIASLPNLQVLKLRCYAFRGPKWEIKGKDFPGLQSLLLEDTDLVHWMIGSGSFAQRLECLILKNCYRLEEIDGNFKQSLASVEIVDCNMFAVNYAKQMHKANKSLKLIIHSSWEDGKLKGSQRG